MRINEMDARQRLDATSQPGDFQKIAVGFTAGRVLFGIRPASQTINGSANKKLNPDWTGKKSASMNAGMAIQTAYPIQSKPIAQTATNFAGGNNYLGQSIIRHAA